MAAGAPTGSGRRACSPSTSSGSRPGSILLEVDYTSARHAINAEQTYSPYEIGLGRLVDLDKGDFVGQLALRREAAAGGPARRLVGLGARLGRHRALYDAQGLPPATRPMRRSRRHVPVFASRRPPGRPGHEPRLEPDPQEADRARLGAAALRADRLAARGRVDRRGPPRPRRRDGRAAALPRPAPQAGLRACGVRRRR